MERVPFMDVLNMSIESANKKFAPLLKMSDEKYTHLKAVCEDFDSLIDEVDADSLETEVDEDNGHIYITIECENLVVEDITDEYCDIIMSTISFGFTQNSVPRLLMKFEFPSIWEI